MGLGDLAYEDVLCSAADHDSHSNFSALHELLLSQYGGFDFIPLINSSVHYDNPTHILDCLTNGTVAESIALPFPSFSYILFILFALLMPVVVLNTLVSNCMYVTSVASY